MSFQSRPFKRERSSGDQKEDRDDREEDGGIIKIVDVPIIPDGNEETKREAPKIQFCRRRNLKLYVRWRGVWGLAYRRTWLLSWNGWEIFGNVQGGDKAAEK